MQFAIDENGVRTYILEAQESGNFFCPVCNAPMIQRRGQINIPHFAHRKGYLCSDNWKYEEMSEWHRAWQAYYPLENQEVTVSNELGCHRADVLINDTVIEFQHSSLSAEEFQERNAFYTQCGFRVVWLFDARDAYQQFISADTIEKGVFHWKYAPKTLTGLDLHGDVHVYLHLQDGTDANAGDIIRITGLTNGELRRFRTSPSVYYTEPEFVELTSTGGIKRNAEIGDQDEYYHTLYTIRRKNGEFECYGCPISEDGYAPTIRETARKACDECSYYRGGDPSRNLIKCAGRFREFLDNAEVLLEKSYKYFNVILLTYIDKSGSICECEVEIPDSPADSILDLAREYNARSIIVQNIKTGHQFLIVKDVDAMLRKYSRIYGFLWYKNNNRWANDSREIYGFGRPEWIPLWFVARA